MSFFSQGRTSNSRKLIPAVYASAATAFLAVQVNDVRAGVFEETCSGKIIAIGSGTQSGVPPQDYGSFADGGWRAAPTSIIELGLTSPADPSDVPTGVTLAAGVPPPASICASPPVGTTTQAGAGLKVIKSLESKLSLPDPLKLSQTFSDDQVEMRELTADVGLRFAHTQGVRKANLDTPTFIKLFTTLVHRESNFKPQAVSPAGAQGLGQLMPLTAQDLGVKDSFSPDENLIGAATYLTEMLDRFESPELALAAYNAGPGAVEKYRGIPPYRETRQYVADILYEVLREPYPAYVAARTKQLAFWPDTGTQLASLTANHVASEDPFATILTWTPQAAQEGARLERAAFTSASDAVPARKASFKVAERPKVLPISGPDPAAEKTAASERETAAMQAVPLLPDLTMLPEPRAFRGELSKAQLASRDLATNIALRRSKAPGAVKLGLSNVAFATLFVALIRRESAFNSQAVSPEGAKGLGQLKPATVRELGVKDPFSARENLEASVKYFTHLLDEFGSPALALAAYNAGPAIVREKDGIPDDRKTRQFVSDVLHDLKSDPRPKFVIARVNDWSAAPIVSPKGVAAEDTVGELARRAFFKSLSSQRAEAHILCPILAATISPAALNGAKNQVALGSFIAALSAVFVFAGLYSVAQSPLSDQQRASGWKRLLRWN